MLASPPCETPVSPRSTDVANLLSQSARTVDHPSFHEPDAESRIFDPSVVLPSPDVSWYLTWNNARDGVIKSSTPTRSPILSAEHEVAYFLRYNYARHRFALLHDQGNRDGLNDDMAADLIRWHDVATSHRNAIIGFNLGLVPYVLTRKIHHPDRFRFLSDGNVALIRAVTRYDFLKGIRFSTFASFIIIQDVLRRLERLSRLVNATDGSEEAYLATADTRPTSDPAAPMAEGETMAVLRDALTTDAAGLTRRERAVLASSYGIDRDREPLRTIGPRFGATKQAAHQWRARALGKLRLYMEGVAGLG